jgi:hypothetical protein
VMSDPFSGIGKPEPLRHLLSGCWSRRITQEHRLVYRVSGGAVSTFFRPGITTETFQVGQTLSPGTRWVGGLSAPPRG